LGSGVIAAGVGRKERFMKNKDRAAWLGEVVTVATKLFLEKGFDATSMEEVGAALGVSKPTIYEAYSSKQHLLEAVVDHAIEDYDVSWLEAAAREDLPFDAFIDRFASELWAQLHTPAAAAIFQLLYREGPKSPLVVAAFHRRMREPSLGLIRDIVLSAIARGECRKMPPEIVYYMLLAPGSFVLHQRTVFGDQAMPSPVATAYLDASRQALKDSLIPKRTGL
jgi:TetR/AcrR family transcriptional regulator, mexJK operon transcriptional repressor